MVFERFRRKQPEARKDDIIRTHYDDEGNVTKREVYESKSSAPSNGLRQKVGGFVKEQKAAHEERSARNRAKAEEKAEREYGKQLEINRVERKQKAVRDLKSQNSKLRNERYANNPFIKFGAGAGKVASRAGDSIFGPAPKRSSRRSQGDDFDIADFFGGRPEPRRSKKSASSSSDFGFNFGNIMGYGPSQGKKRGRNPIEGWF